MKNIYLKRENRGLRSRSWRCQRVKQHSVCAHGWRAMSKRLAEDVDEAEEAELERLEGPRAGARGRGGGRSCASAASLRPAERAVSSNGNGEGVVQAERRIEANQNQTWVGVSESVWEGGPFRPLAKRSALDETHGPDWPLPHR